MGLSEIPKSMMIGSVNQNSTRGRVLYIAYKYFDENPRIQRQVDALEKHGYSVDIICVRRPGDRKRTDKRFFSIPVVRKRGTRLRYLFEYFTFLCYASVMCAFLQIRYRYKLIQVDVMPEVLMLSCLLPKLFGVRILMDWADPSKETFAAKFGGGSLFPYQALLTLFERAGAWTADEIITANQGFRRKFLERGHDPNKIRVVMNGPDPRLLDEIEVNRFSNPENHFTVLFNGTLTPRHGLHVAIQAYALSRDRMSNTSLRIAGDGEEEYIRRCHDLIEELGIADSVEYLGRIDFAEIPEIIGSASVGIVANTRNPYTEINFPQRILEFALLKTPVVVSRFPGVEDCLDERDVFFFEPGDEKDLAARIDQIYRDPDCAMERAENAFKKCMGFSWEYPYLELVDRMAGNE